MVAKVPNQNRLSAASTDRIQNTRGILEIKKNKILENIQFHGAMVRYEKATSFVHNENSGHGFAVTGTFAEVMLHRRTMALPVFTSSKSAPPRVVLDSRSVR